ncbi:MAG TPA: XRE family transcriptional regulator [Ruminococcus sp.]|nr:XRE family transcriptional regulator [Ruminococcus sp.]
MSLSYEKLFILMKEKGLTTYRIRKENIISQSALSALKNGKSVTTETIEKLCRALGCQPGDIMEYVEDNQEIFLNVRNKHEKNENS